MGIPKLIADEFVFDDVREQPTQPSGPDERVNEASDVPSCTAALAARPFDEQIAPI